MGCVGSLAVAGPGAVALAVAAGCVPCQSLAAATTSSRSWHHVRCRSAEGSPLAMAGGKAPAAVAGKAAFADMASAAGNAVAFLHSLAAVGMAAVGGLAVRLEG